MQLTRCQQSAILSKATSAIIDCSNWLSLKYGIGYSPFSRLISLSKSEMMG